MLRAPTATDRAPRRIPSPACGRWASRRPATSRLRFDKANFLLVTGSGRGGATKLSHRECAKAVGARLRRLWLELCCCCSSHVASLLIHYCTTRQLVPRARRRPPRVRARGSRPPCCELASLSRPATSSAAPPHRNMGRPTQFWEWPPLDTLRQRAHTTSRKGCRTDAVPTALLVARGAAKCS